ncbi:mCG1813, partial [Mus musculus]
ACGSSLETWASSHLREKHRQREVPQTRKPAASLRAVMRTPRPESACGPKAGRDLLYLPDWSPGQTGRLRASWSLCGPHSSQVLHPHRRLHSSPPPHGAQVHSEDNQHHEMLFIQLGGA